MSSLALTLRPLEFFFAQYRRVWRASVISSVVTPVVYLLALGVGMGAFLGDVTLRGETYAYFEFVAPGLLAATAMQLASFEASWPVLSAIKWTASTTRCSRRRSACATSSWRTRRSSRRGC